jgi:predicted ATPase
LTFLRYGRDEELNFLRNAIQSDNETKMCLVSGYSGSGKSKLIEELVKLPNMNLTIGYGKFDQFNRTTPYFAFIQ